MECFIIEKGLERKAELEDILPLISDSGIQYLLRDAIRENIDLPYVLAHMPDEIKNLVYRNLIMRIRRRIEKIVKIIEVNSENANGFMKSERKKLISIIEKNRYRIRSSEDFDRIIWKEKKPNKEISNIETSKKEAYDPVNELIKNIEDACNSGILHLCVIDKRNISKEINNIQSAFIAFQDRKNELQKIRRLLIAVNLLPAAAMLFEAGSIDDLDIFDAPKPDNEPEIHDDFDGTWPSFLKNCGTLKSITLDVLRGLNEFPLWIRNAVSLRRLYIYGSNINILPDWIGDLQFLTELELRFTGANLKTLPDNIGKLINLSKLTIKYSGIERLPDSIGNLFSLKELTLYGKSITSLPDSIGNLKELNKLVICNSDIKTLPDFIGNMENLTVLSLQYNEKLLCLPDNIGKLKNLKTLDLYDSAIEKLPDTMSNCSSLEYIDIRRANINSLPDSFSSIKYLNKILKQSIEVIPIKQVYSYRSFCNCYYSLTANLIQFAVRARAEGILALEKELENIHDDFFKEGLRLLVCGTDKNIIRHILTINIEREPNYYKKKLMELTMEGILCILNGDNISHIGIIFASMVNIKNNPLNETFEKYLAGDYEAFEAINFKAAFQPEEEREEIRFINRAAKISEISIRKNWLEIEKELDNDFITARDVFEYGIFLMVECWNYKKIEKVLTMLVDNEADPVRKNFALAKKDAVRMIYEGDNPRIVKQTLSAYFDDDIKKKYLSEADEE